jgi:tetratricopeptide (TPR) repeat protein
MVMANIYARCGDYDKALDELEELLSSQTYYTVHDFELNANLIPLRHLPRYQELIRKYGADAGS